MAHEFIDLTGFLLLVFITIPLTSSTNIDCGGKPFHCLNTTHFMICVDLGGGMSTTIDDFIIPCPQSTVCQKDNRFECEFPKIEQPTTPLFAIGASNEYDKSVSPQIMNKITTIPPEEATTVLVLPEKETVKEMPSRNAILESLKEEFTGGNEKIFEENIVFLPSSPSIDEIVTTTDKYLQPNLNVETSGSDEVAATFGTDIPTLKEIVRIKDKELININKNSTSSRLNTTKRNDKNDSSEFNGSLNNVVKKLELTTLLPNSNFERSYNIDQIPGNISFNYQPDSPDLYQNVNDSAFVSGNMSDMPINNLNTTQPVLPTIFKNTDNDFISTSLPKYEKSNSLTVIANSTVMNDGTNNITEILKKYDEHKDISAITSNPMKISAAKFSLKTPRMDNPNLEDTFTEGLATINTFHANNKLNISHDIDQINELNKTLDMFVNKLEMTTSLPNLSIEGMHNIEQNYNNTLFNQSVNLDLKHRVSNLAPIIVAVNETTIDTLRTSETVLPTTSKYHDNADNLISSKAVENSTFIVKSNIKINNYSADSIPKNNKKGDAHKNMFESVTANQGEISTTNTPVSVDYDSGTTNSNIKFVVVPSVINVNHDSNFSDKHDILQTIATTDLPIEIVTQSISENISTIEQNYIILDSNESMYKRESLINNDYIINAKGNTEINERKSIYNDNSIYVDLYKTNEGKVKAQTDSTEQNSLTKISKPDTTFQLSSTTTTTNEQIILTDDNPMNNPISFVETSTIQDPTTFAIANNFTTYSFNETPLDIKTTMMTSVDLIRNDSNNTINKEIMAIGVVVESSTSLAGITPGNINITDDYDTYVTNHDNSSDLKKILAGEESITPSTKTEKNDTSVNQGHIVDSEAFQFTTPISANIVLKNRFRNLTELKKSQEVDNASVLSRTTSTTENANVFSSNNNSRVEEYQGKTTVIKSLTFPTDTSGTINDIKSKNIINPISTTAQGNMKPIAEGYTTSSDVEGVPRENLSTYINVSTSQQVNNVDQLHNSVNAPLSIRQNDDTTLKSLESMLSNIESRHQNVTSFMETANQQSSTTPNPITNVLESISSANLSTGTPIISASNMTGHTYYVDVENSTLAEYKEQNKTGNTITSKPDINRGVSKSISKTPPDLTIKTDEPMRKLTDIALNSTSNQATLLPTSNENEKRTSLATFSVTDTTELQTAYGDGILTLSTPKEATTRKQNNIVVNRILANTPVSLSQDDTNNSGKVGEQIVSLTLPVTPSTTQIISNDLDSASTLPKLKETKMKKQSNYTDDSTAQSTSPSPEDIMIRKQSNNTFNRMLSSTMVSDSQFNMDDLHKLATQIVSSTVTESTEDTIGNDSGNFVIEPTTIVETINVTHKIDGQSILSDIYLNDFTFTNGTVSNSKINFKLNTGKYDVVTEKVTYEESENKTYVPNTSSEDVSLGTINNTLVDRQMNIDISHVTNDNETSAENYKSSTTYNEIVSQVQATSHGSSGNNTLFDNIGNNFTVDCLTLPRGKYADSKDCTKFYICIGKLVPALGTCPNNTVFSEINKQCTRNLSHCVRNNQFHCLYEGRFGDLLKDNIYYICVKNSLKGFFRYTFQCMDGYHLNKVKVKCEQNVEMCNQSETSLSNSINVSNDKNSSISKSNVSENSESSGFICKKEGKFPHAKDCRKYYMCTKNSKDEYRRKIIICSSDEVYDRTQKKCVSADSEEC